MTVQSSNGNNEQQQESRPKVSSLVFKFGGDRNKKVPTYTFSPGKFKYFFLIELFEKIHLAEQATIDQQQHNVVTTRAPSSPQPQISPQIKSYVNKFF